MRTCVGCRDSGPQQELLRVAASRGTVRFGRSLPGRGAWLCVDPRCLDAALQRRALERALRVGPSAIDAEALRDGLEVAGAARSA